MKVMIVSGHVIIHAFKRYVTIGNTGITAGKVKTGFNQNNP